MKSDAPSPDQIDFVLSRTFDAPRELVWKAWTDRDHLMRWFGPKGFTIPTCNLDLRPGGIFHYCMRAPTGQEMWGKWVFREIVPLEKIVLIQSFSDANGAVVPAPMIANWPLETMSTTTFREENGRTTINLRWAPYNATEVQRKTFGSNHDSMRGGWGGTMDQLAAYLKTAK